ncbi:CBS domain-containing protein, partial [Rhizobium ruizarguesonis]
MTEINGGSTRSSYRRRSNNYYERGRTMQAKDIMTTNVVSIGPAVGIRHAVAVMMQNNVSGLPVIDDEG